MSESVCTPQYFQIALDIAGRIAQGELEEGGKIYGRSVMSSEYGVSPETIRRALKLLSDMEVVEIKPKSSVVILSAENARRYVDRFGAAPNIRELRTQLKNTIAEHASLSKKMVEIASEIAKIDESMSSATPFRNYEVQIPVDAQIAGKNVGELRFWQTTGATVIAVRRGGSIILSPGPYAQLLAYDVVVFIGDTTAVQAVIEFVSDKKTVT